MVRFFAILCVLVFSSAAQAGDDFLEQVLAHHGQNALAYGDGVYQGKKFLWVAHMNSDLLVQFDLSVKLDEKTAARVIGIKDSLMRPSEVRVTPTKDASTTYVQTWVGMSNDWADKFCPPPDCSISVAAGQKGVYRYLLQINHALEGEGMMKLAGYPAST